MASRIELRDGSVYQDVTYRLNDEYKVMRIEADSVDRTVSYTQIVLIANEAGTDITADCIGEYFKGPTAHASAGATSGSHRGVTGDMSLAPMGEHTLPFSLSIRSGGNLSLPIGDYYDGITSGFGYDVDLVLTVTRELAIRGSMSRAGLRDDFDSFAGLTVLDDQLTFTARRYVLAAEFYNWPEWRSGGRTVYYAFTGLGAIAQKFSGSITVRDDTMGDVTLIPNDISETKFLIESGIGVILMVSRDIGIDLSVAADMVFIGTNKDDEFNGYPYYDNIQRAFIIDFRAGLAGVF